MWDGKTVSLVFPAYNEEPNIESAVRQFAALRGFDGSPLIDEILVVDNNSKDRTKLLAQRSGARVITELKQGYGYALQSGLRNASGELIIMTEPDGTFEPNDTFKLLTYSSEFEMVCGTRTSRLLIWEEANMGWYLRIGNVAVAKFMEVLYGTPCLTDCGCTFRLIRRSAVTKILGDLHVGGSHFLPNMIIAARTHRLKFIEIPLNYMGRVGQSKITGTFKGAFNTGMRMIGLMLASWPAYVAWRVTGGVRAKKAA